MAITGNASAQNNVVTAAEYQAAADEITAILAAQRQQRAPLEAEQELLRNRQELLIARQQSALNTLQAAEADPSNTEFLGTLRRGASPDYGLGAELINSPNPQWRNLATINMGKFRTPTLRNVAKGEENKRFMHNGVLQSLEEVVHFYNTRDVDPMWRSPEVIINMETGDVGNLGLSKKEELAIVAFLRTLSDGWISSKGSRQTKL